MISPDEARAQDFPLGVPGFTFADLYRVERLPALSASFDAALRDSDPTLFQRFEAYRSAETGTGGTHGLSKPEE